jgi:uncharacterized membrane protein HdeD (DUF308 family)
MDFSIAFSRVIGIFYLLAGISFLLNKSLYKEIMHKAKKDTGFLFIMSSLSLVTGLIVITNHNIWVKEWYVLVTLLGWLLTLKGATFLLFPEFAVHKIKKLDKMFGRVVNGSLGVVIGYILVFASFVSL